MFCKLFVVKVFEEILLDVVVFCKLFVVEVLEEILLDIVVCGAPVVGTTVLIEDVEPELEINVVIKFVMAEPNVTEFGEDCSFSATDGLLCNNLSPTTDIGVT